MIRCTTEFKHKITLNKFSQLKKLTIILKVSIIIEYFNFDLVCSHRDLRNYLISCLYICIICIYLVIIADHNLCLSRATYNMNFISYLDYSILICKYKEHKVIEIFVE